MQIGHYRKHIIILFIIGIIFILLTAVSFWNAFQNFEKKETIGAFPLISSLLSIFTFGYLFNIALKITDTKKLDSFIEQKVSEGRAALISEMSKDDEKAEEDDDELEYEEKIKKMLPGSNIKKPDTFSKKMLSNLADTFNLVQGIFYQHAGKTNKFSFVAGYSLTNEDPIPDFKMGEGLNGEAAKNQEIMVIDDIPGDYFKVTSGLGSSKPGCLIIVPIVSNNKTIALIELASFTTFDKKKLKMMEKFSEIVSDNIVQIIKA